MFHQANDPSRELVLTSSSYLPDPTPTPQSQAAFNASNNKLTGGQWSYLDGVIETGNLTRDNAGRTFTYDLENRQKTFNGTTYVYDGEGRRAEKVAGGRTTIFVYNALGQLVADYSGLPPSETSGTSYVTVDHLGARAW